MVRMDVGMTRLVAEADHLVRRAAWIAQRGIPADAHAAGKCTKCGGWIVAMTAREWDRAVSEPYPHCGVKTW